MQTLLALGICLLAYLLGAVPFGLLIARAHGVDIRQHGSGNIGATNVMRILGRGPGITTFALDFGKGVVATQLPPLLAWLLKNSAVVASTNNLWVQLGCGVCVMLGHSYPVFLGFRGGKGVATGAGLVAGLAPLAALVGFVVWLVTFLLSRYVSLGSMMAAVAVGICGWAFYGKREPLYLMPTVLTILSILVILRHRSNISRLIKGTESHFEGRKKKKS